MLQIGLLIMCMILLSVPAAAALNDSKSDILARSRIAVSTDGKIVMAVQRNINYLISGEADGELRLPLVFANLSGEPGTSIYEVRLEIEGVSGQSVKSVSILFPELAQADAEIPSLHDLENNRFSFTGMREITAMSMETLRLPGRIEKGTAQNLLITAAIQNADGSQSTVKAKSTITFRSLPVRTGWYGGDGHMHSTLSDGLDRPEERAAYLKSAGMGWGVLTDHEKIVRGIFDAYIQKIAESAKKTGFPLAAGMEIAAEGERGHALAYGLNGQMDSSLLPVDYQYACQALIDQINRLAPGSSFTVLAHPYSSAVWQDITFNHGFQAMEIASGGVINDQAIAEWMRRLRSGERITALGSSDCHLGYPDGMTYLYIPDYSKTDFNPVFNAIRMGRASVSEKGNLAVFAVNGQAIGSTIKTAPGAPLTFTLIQQTCSGAACTSIELLDENGQTVYQAANPPETTAIIKSAASSFYLLRAFFSDGSKAVSNPVYIEQG